MMEGLVLWVRRKEGGREGGKGGREGGRGEGRGGGTFVGRVEQWRREGTDMGT